MHNKLLRMVVMSLLLVGIAACSPDDDPPPPPVPVPTPPPVPVPAPPEGTDFSQPGGHGSVGVESHEDDETVIDTPISNWNEIGSLMGSSTSEMGRWDSVQDLEKCPEQPIYVYGTNSEDSVAQCADGAGYAGTCETAERQAKARAVNVVRSCQRLPSCDGVVQDVGQEWECKRYPEVRFTDENGNEVVRPERWVKSCWVQYKVVCIEI